MTRPLLLALTLLASAASAQTRPVVVTETASREASSCWAEVPVLRAGLAAARDSTREQAARLDSALSGLARADSLAGSATAAYADALSACREAREIREDQLRQAERDRRTARRQRDLARGTLAAVVAAWVADRLGLLPTP